MGLWKAIGINIPTIKIGCFVEKRITEMNESGKIKEKLNPEVALTTENL